MQALPPALTELARFKGDVAYYEVHRDELLAQYPGMWIAIYDEAVAATAAEVEDLLTALRQRGVPPERALVKHLSRDEDLLILPT